MTWFVASYRSTDAAAKFEGHLLFTVPLLLQLPSLFLQISTLILSTWIKDRFGCFLIF